MRCPPRRSTESLVSSTPLGSSFPASHRKARLVLAGALLGAAFTGPLQAEKLVTVRSVVDPAYAARRAASAPPPVETFVFIRGKYFNEIPMDRYLERMDFRTIATTLAMDLKKQNFEPAPSLLAADLLLVVHWGVTQANERNAELFAHDPDGLRLATVEYEAARAALDNAGAAGGNSVLNAVMDTGLALRAEQSTNAAAFSRNEARGETNSVLLGFQTAMARESKMPFNSALGETLQLMVNEERYFVIVIAYDGAALREGKKRRVWTTRMSIRAAGVNFALALDRLSGAGANFHGKRQDSLAFEMSAERPDHGPGTVKIGELTVIGDDAPARPSR